jgi:hypothetical protein
MKMSIIVAIVVAAIAVPAGVYAASPLFISTTINEPAPIAYNMMDDELMQDSTMADNNEAMMDDNSLETMMDKDSSMMNLYGSFVGVGDGIHNAEGFAKVVYVEGGSDVLRLEDLRVTNGPDLYVYLATDEEASDFVSLGRLKANNGSQNYDIPEGTDLSKYDTVLVWCKQFSVLFGSAELTTGKSA